MAQLGAAVSKVASDKEVASLAAHKVYNVLPLLPGKDIWLNMGK